MSDCKSNILHPTNMKFPEKLWLIVNECASGAIGWGQTGETITLESSKFRDEYLCKDAGVFKTNNIASFVRQLNLYGFRKKNRFNEKTHEFKHPLFVKGRRDLLEYIKRKPGGALGLHSTVGSSKKLKRFSTYQENFESTNQAEKDFGRKSPKTGLKRNSSQPLQNPNIMSPLNPFWWSTASQMAYSNLYRSRDLSSQNWMQTDNPFYSSVKIEPDVDQNDASYYYPNFDIKENIPHPDARSNGTNMYFMVMPGFPPSANRSIYSNPGFYNGIFPFSPLVVNPNSETKCTEAYSREVKPEDLTSYSSFI